MIAQANEVQLEYVSEFSDNFTGNEENTDGHGLTDHTQLTLRDEYSVCEGPGHVAVRGEHPWEYRYGFTVSKGKLERANNRVRRTLDRDGYDSKTIETIIEDRYSAEARIRQMVIDVLRDGRATPHKMSQDDYDAWVEVVEDGTQYRVMVAWEPSTDKQGECLGA